MSVSGESDHPAGAVRVVGGEADDFTKTHVTHRTRYGRVAEYGQLYVELAEGRILTQLQPPSESSEVDNGWSPPAGFDPRRIYCDVGNPGSEARVEVTYNVSGEDDGEQTHMIVLPKGASRSVVGALKIKCTVGRISVYGNYTKPVVNDEETSEDGE